MVTVLQGLTHTHTHTHTQFLQGLKHTHTSKYMSSHGLGTWERKSYHQSRTSNSLPERKAFNLYFYHGHFLLLVSALFSLIIKPHIQFMFARPQRGYFP